MTTVTQDPTYYVAIDPTLRRLVEQAKAAARDDAETCKRIHRAAALVEAGAVTFSAGRCTVQSDNALYPVMRRCPCPDMAHRGTPCKHLYAKWLALRLAQETHTMPQRTKQFFASLEIGESQVHGVLTLTETGAGSTFASYPEYGQDAWTFDAAEEWHHLCLGGELTAQ
jgi:hypothetical protein